MNLDDLNRPLSAALVTRQYKNALKDLTDFYDGAKSSRGGQCASIVGPSGTGKSWLVTGLAKEVRSRSADVIAFRTMITIEIPSKPSIRAFYEALLDKLGGPILPREPNGALRRRILHFLKVLGVRVIVIDEFQHLARKVGSDLYGVCDTIKSLMNEGQIGIIFVGVPEAEDVIQLDEQILTRRVMQIRIRAFCDTQNPDYQGENGDFLRTADFDEFKSVLVGLSKDFGCPDAEYLVEDEVAQRVLEYTKGVFRVVDSFMRQAARNARERGKQGIDATAIREVLRLKAITTNSEVPQSEPSKESRTRSRKMSKREKDLRSANGEFTTRQTHGVKLELS